MDGPAETTSTTPANSAVAQSSEPDASPAASVQQPSGDVIRWKSGENLTRAQLLDPYRRQKDDPLYRPLRIYTLDPSHSKLEGGVATVDIPYEPLEPGPKGRLFEVDAVDGRMKTEYRSVDLESRHILISRGVDPSPSNSLFHQQMVYAVASSVYNAFKTALGRDLAFGFLRYSEAQPERLRLSPFAFEGRNAFYDPLSGAVNFGYFEADAEVSGRALPGGFIFTALSHDIIAHEVSHALLDGLRSHFITPTNRDVFALHEGFADLIAIFQHFSYSEIVLAAIRNSKGNLRKKTLLSDIALQFGQTTGLGTSLRTAIDFSDGVPIVRYEDASESHQLGAVLVAAVFDAFNTIFERRIEPLLRLASGGTGVLPKGELPHDLQSMLAQRAAKTAAQFLSICIRAIDYCPPVDVTFGEFLRAAITADVDLIPDDRYAYREAWLDAFRCRGIHPNDIKILSEDAVVWRPPAYPLPPIEELSFGSLQFKGDPATPMSATAVERQATALANVVCDRTNLGLFGLSEENDPDLEGDRIECPVVHSIRSSRRVGPDSQIKFDLVAEVTQVRWAKTDDGRVFPFLGGSTIITGPDGDIRYAIVKNLTSKTRIARMREYLDTTQAQTYWRLDGRDLRPQEQPFCLLHDKKPR